MATEMVYAISQVGTGFVKIGHSNDPNGRRELFQTGSPIQLDLVWQAPGGARLERALHRHFAARSVRGEWFDFGTEDAPSLLASAVERIGTRTSDALHGLKAPAEHYRATRKAYEDSRADLNGLIYESREMGPSKIARLTGYTREWVAKVITAEEKRRAKS